MWCKILIVVAYAAVARGCNNVVLGHVCSIKDRQCEVHPSNCVLGTISAMVKQLTAANLEGFTIYVNPYNLTQCSTYQSDTCNRPDPTTQVHVYAPLDTVDLYHPITIKTLFSGINYNVNVSTGMLPLFHIASDHVTISDMTAIQVSAAVSYPFSSVIMASTVTYPTVVSLENVTLDNINFQLAAGINGIFFEGSSEKPMILSDVTASSISVTLLLSNILTVPAMLVINYYLGVMSLMDSDGLVIDRASSSRVILNAPGGNIVFDNATLHVSPRISVDSVFGNSDVSEETSFGARASDMTWGFYAILIVFAGFSLLLVGRRAYRKIAGEDGVVETSKED